MSGVMWMVEVKIGKVWEPMTRAYSRSEARRFCKEYNHKFMPGHYRVRKYQRVEP